MKMVNGKQLLFPMLPESHPNILPIERVVLRNSTSEVSQPPLKTADVNEMKNVENEANKVLPKLSISLNEPSTTPTVKQPAATVTPMKEIILNETPSTCSTRIQVEIEKKKKKSHARNRQPGSSNVDVVYAEFLKSLELFNVFQPLPKKVPASESDLKICPLKPDESTVQKPKITPIKENRGK